MCWSYLLSFLLLLFLPYLYIFLPTIRLFIPSTSKFPAILFFRHLFHPPSWLPSSSSNSFASFPSCCPFFFSFYSLLFSILCLFFFLSFPLIITGSGLFTLPYSHYSSVLSSLFFCLCIISILAPPFSNSLFSTRSEISFPMGLFIPRDKSLQCDASRAAIN